MIESSLWSFLDDELECKVYPLHLPQSPDYPAVTYQQVSRERHFSHKGFSYLTTARYQINSWSKSYSEAKGIARDVIEAARGYSGDMEGITIGLITVDTETDSYHEDSGVYQVVVDLIIHYEED